MDGIISEAANVFQTQHKLVSLLWYPPLHGHTLYPTFEDTECFFSSSRKPNLAPKLP